MYKKLSLGIFTILATAAILTVPSSELQVSYAQTNQDLESSILDMHNSERDAVGVAPLMWNNNLAADAQTWAQQIATTGQFAHDPVSTGLSCTGPCYGENIAGFITGVSEPNGGQSKWAAEKSSYNGETHTCTGRSSVRSLHSDGLADQSRDRLRDRAPRCWRSSLQHTGVSLRPSGQRSGAAFWGTSSSYG